MRVYLSALLLATACTSPLVDDNAQGVAGGTCDPARAVGVATPAQKALLDTIAWSEGTRGVGDDGYNVTFGYHFFSDCTVHPKIPVCEGSLCSDAAGRYQFLSTTWGGLGFANFYPEDQERGALKLIANKYKVPADRPLTSSEFVDLMNQISWTWASLPPGRYGQPIHAMAAERAEYCGFAGCDGSSPPPPPTGPQCVNNPGTGDNCGDESVISAGDAATLYRCQGAGAAAVVQKCAYGCQHNPPGTDDACKEPPAVSCVNNPGTGDNCGDESVIAGGDKNTLYHCNGAGAATVIAACQFGCVHQPPGVPDTCNAQCVNNPGTGNNCGDQNVISGGRANTLYRCNGTGAATIVAVCGSCKHNPPGVDDTCN